MSGTDRGGKRTDATGDDERPVLPTRSRDDSDIGWGDDADRGEGRERDEEWYRRERPPHHGD